MRKFFAVIFLASFISSKAQTLDSVLAKYASDYQPEKMYLHYDKSSYYAGETIWFKAYIMQGLFPSDAKTTYIDWIADDGKVLSHTVSPVVDGTTNGQFEVPTDYTGSFVHVRAYTRWMMNFDTAFLYSKDIPVLSKDPVKKTPVAIIPSLQLFPEGGDLVAGINNRIAFLANDQFGRPVPVKGKLIDSKGTVLQNFSSVHDGMGSFEFRPETGIQYSVKCTDAKNKEYTTTLPSIRNQGITMQVSNKAGSRVVTINGSAALPENLKRLHLIGTMNQQPIFRNEINLDDGASAVRNIPTGNMLTGILTITVLDANNNAIAERVSFINNNDYSFQPTMEVQHWGLGKRKRNELRISIPDSLQGASLSISVTDASIEKDTTDNIISNFLLSSDIRGRVYNPAYYFSNNSDSVSQHLDLVMMTHGWRRFKWEDIKAGVVPTIKYPKDTAYLSLSGQLYGVAKSQLSGKEIIALLIKERDTISKILLMPIKTDGSFNDPNIILFDTLKVYYSLKSKFLQQAEAKFMVNRLPSPNYTAFTKNFMYSNSLLDTSGLYRHSVLGSKSLELLNIERGQIMKTVVITTTKKRPVEELDKKYASGLFQSGDAYQFDLTDDPTSVASMNALYYLQGKVAGLQVNTSNSPPTLTWRGGAPVLYLDEMQTDADMVSSVPVSDIAYIKVFRPPFMGGTGGSNGAIAIYTRKGNDVAPGRGGLSSNLVAGYTPIKEFYSPNYDRYDPKNDRLDIRTTLYWNPLLMEPSQGKKQVVISFYNNDVTKSFRVVIEGMSREGYLTHYEQIME